MKIKDYEKMVKKIINKLNPYLKPVLNEKLNQQFTIKTENAFGREIRDKPDFEKLLSEKIGHPVFGPIAVEGVKAGDTVEIEIVDIKLNDKAYQCISKSTGILKDQFTTRNYKIHKITNGQINFGKSSGVKMPVRPSVGFIATLPNEEMGCGRACEFGGNIDINHLQKGAKLLLPTAHDKAMLCVGDLHALQGNGEICGMALECGGEVTLRVSKAKEKIDYPVIKSDKGIVVVGHGKTIKEASVNAVENAIDYWQKNQEIAKDMTKDMTKEDVYLYLSASSDLIFGNFTGKVKTCGVWVKKNNLFM
jgi:amidase